MMEARSTVLGKKMLRSWVQGEKNANVDKDNSLFKKCDWEGEERLRYILSAEEQV